MKSKEKHVYLILLAKTNLYFYTKLFLIKETFLNRKELIFVKDIFKIVGMYYFQVSLLVFIINTLPLYLIALLEVVLYYTK